MTPRLGLSEISSPGEAGQVLRQSPTGTWRWVTIGPPLPQAEAERKAAELRRANPGREYRVVPAEGLAVL